jgi:small conductance mechanosensitive channel
LWIGTYWILFAPNKELDPLFNFCDILVIGSITGTYTLASLRALLGLQHWDAGLPIQTILAHQIIRLVTQIFSFVTFYIACAKTAQTLGFNTELLRATYYVVLTYIWVGLFIRHNRAAITKEINAYSEDLFLETHWLNITYLALGFFCLLTIADTGIEDRLLLTVSTVALVAMTWALDWYLIDYIIKFWSKLKDCGYHTNYNIALFIARILLVVSGFLTIQSIWQISYIPYGPPYITMYAFLLKLAIVVLGTEVLIVGSGIALQRVALQEHEFNIEKRKQRTSTLFPVIKLGFNVMRLVGCTMLILATIGLEPQSIIYNISISLAGLSYLLKEEVAGVLSGLALVLEDAVNIGDLVEVEHTLGEIEEIGLRSLRIRSIDGTLHYIPFASIRILRNKSKEYSYVMLNIAVAPNTDLDRLAITVKNAFVATIPKIEQENITFGKIEQRGVVELRGDRLVYQVRIKCSRGKQFIVKRALNAELYREFQTHGIEIPIPQNMTFQNSSISDSEYMLR